MIKAIKDFLQTKERLKNAEKLLHNYNTFLFYAHLANNNSRACAFARYELSEYKKKYSLNHWGGA